MPCTPIFLSLVQPSFDTRQTVAKFITQCHPKHKMHSVTHDSYNGWQNNVPWNCVRKLCSAHSGVNNRHWQLYNDITLPNVHFLHSSCYTFCCSCYNKSNCLYVHDSSRVLQCQDCWLQTTENIYACTWHVTAMQQYLSFACQKLNKNNCDFTGPFCRDFHLMFKWRCLNLWLTRTASTKEIISQERYKVHFFSYYANSDIYITAEHKQSKERQITEWPVHMPACSINFWWQPSEQTGPIIWSCSQHIVSQWKTLQTVHCARLSEEIWDTYTTQTSTKSIDPFLKEFWAACFRRRDKVRMSTMDS